MLLYTQGQTMELQLNSWVHEIILNPTLFFQVNSEKTALR